MNNYIFRNLAKQDIPQIKSLFAKAFSANNNVFHKMEMGEEDGLLLVNNNNFDLILDQQLSYGAFKGDLLASMAIFQDFTLKHLQPQENNQKILEIFQYFADVTKEFKQENVHAKDGEILYLNTLATHPDHTKNLLAQKCISLGVEDAKKRGYKIFYTEAGHVATLKAVSAVIPQIKVPKSVDIKGAFLSLMAGQL